jgi:hypothetical protein
LSNGLGAAEMAGRISASPSTDVVHFLLQSFGSYAGAAAGA